MKSVFSALLLAGVAAAPIALAQSPQGLSPPTGALAGAPTGAMAGVMTGGMAGGLASTDFLFQPSPLTTMSAANGAPRQIWPPASPRQAAPAPAPAPAPVSEPLPTPAPTAE